MGQSENQLNKLVQLELVKAPQPFNTHCSRQCAEQQESYHKKVGIVFEGEREVVYFNSQRGKNPREALSLVEIQKRQVQKLDKGPQVIPEDNNQ